jgi:lysophospholipase L1-like esterase
MRQKRNVCISAGLFILALYLAEEAFLSAVNGIRLRSSKEPLHQPPGTVLVPTTAQASVNNSFPRSRVVSVPSLVVTPNESAVGTELSASIPRPIDYCAAAQALSSHSWPTKPERWTSSIAAFERAARASPPAPGGIVFVGSSTIRLWAPRLKQDFRGLNVIGRGFGGSALPDSTYFAKRIIAPYKPRQIVLFAGSNDIAAKRTAKDVAEDFRHFVNVVRCLLPATRISFLEITSCPSRWAQRAEVVAANALIRQLCETGNNTDFIPARSEFLYPDGSGAREQLFAKDRLHLNAAGYDILARLVRPWLVPS